jgi:hypothetical protein
MKGLLARLRSLRDSRRASVPLQYAIVAAGTAIVTMMIVAATGNKVADKLNAVTAALHKSRFSTLSR